MQAIVFILSLLLAGIPTYGWIILLLINEWFTNPWATHGVLVPFMAAYLAYQKRGALNLEWHSDTKQRVYGIVILAIAMAFTYAVKDAIYMLHLILLSLPLFLTGLIIIFYGTKTAKTLLPALLFLIFLIPPDSSVANEYGYDLVKVEGAVAVSVVEKIIPIEMAEKLQGVTILTIKGGKGGEFALSPECSSGYAIIPFIIFSVFVALSMPGRLLRKAIVAIVCIPFIFLINSIRIGMILLISYYLGPEIALKTFHVFGGLTLFILFAAVYLILIHKYAMKKGE